jgi:hypothetical protein
MKLEDMEIYNILMEIGDEMMNNYINTLESKTNHKSQ